MADNSTTPWLAGYRLDEFPGPSFGEQVAQAAHRIHADILSPTATVAIPSLKDPSEMVPFTTQSLFNEAHRLGMEVKPFTVSHSRCHRTFIRCPTRLMPWTSPMSFFTGVQMG